MKRKIITTKFPALSRPLHGPRTFFALALCLAALSCGAQEERPALIPNAQGGGTSTAAAAAASVANIGGLTDEPISPGQVVHVIVFSAPDLSVTTRVSGAGDIAYPILGAVHVDGLDSASASKLIATQLKQKDLMLDPQVTVTVEGFSTGITILGEVRVPGIYPALGKHLLSDVIATAGGLTATSGRVVEISNSSNPAQKEDLAWDPTMHNTSSFDHPVHPGDRILVRACGIAYVGGHVAKPGAFSLCGSPSVTLSELIALAGGIVPLTSDKHSYLIREQPDGTRTVEEVDLHKILLARSADPVVHEDDIVYVTPSTVKDVLTRALLFGETLGSALIYTRNQ
ncbi:MAG TPA: SLBB domain-containing protein [Terracidiphilus sp.]|nr:SLBB domain-containing protein [Terracidiphilus sp.]